MESPQASGDLFLASQHGPASSAVTVPGDDVPAVAAASDHSSASWQYQEQQQQQQNAGLQLNQQQVHLGGVLAFSGKQQQQHQQQPQHEQRRQQDMSANALSAWMGQLQEVQQQQHEEQQQQQEQLQHHLASRISTESPGSSWDSCSNPKAPGSVALRSACATSSLTMSPIEGSSSTLVLPARTETCAAPAVPGRFVMGHYAADIDGASAFAAVRGDVGVMGVGQQPFLALSQGLLVEEWQQQAQHDPRLHLQTLQSQMQQLQQQVQEFASKKYPSLQQLGQWDQQIPTSVEIQELQQLLHQKELVSQQLQLLVEGHSGVQQKGVGSTQQVVLDSGGWEGHAQRQQRVQQAQHGQQVQLVSTGPQQMPRPEQQQRTQRSHLPALQQQVEQQQTLWALPLLELEECLEDIQHAQQQQQQNHLYQQPKEQQFNQLLQECFQQVRHLQQLQQQQQQQQQQSQQSQLAGVQQQQQQPQQEQQHMLEKCFEQLHKLVQLQQGGHQVEYHPQQLLNVAAADDTLAGQLERSAGTAGAALAAGTPAAAAEWAMPTGSAAGEGSVVEATAMAAAAAAAAGAAGGAGPTMCVPACTSDWEVPGSSEVADPAAASHSAGFSPWDLREMSATLDDIFADCDMNSLRLMFRSDSVASGTAEMMQIAELNSSSGLEFLHLEDLELNTCQITRCSAFWEHVPMRPQGEW